MTPVVSATERRVILKYSITVKLFSSNSYESRGMKYIWQLADSKAFFQDGTNGGEIHFRPSLLLRITIIEHSIIAHYSRLLLKG